MGRHLNHNWCKYQHLGERDYMLFSELQRKGDVAWCKDQLQDQESYADVILASGHVINKHIWKEGGQTNVLFSVVLKVDALYYQTIYIYIYSAHPVSQVRELP